MTNPSAPSEPSSSAWKPSTASDSTATTAAKQGAAAASSAATTPKSKSACPTLKPLATSEAMRRMRDMLSFHKLSTSDRLVFTYKHTSYTATLMSDGSLKATPPRAQHPKLYSSPSEFASEMATKTETSPAAPPKKKISVNGWAECEVNGRSLESIRNEMLRQRQTDANKARDKLNMANINAAKVVKPSLISVPPKPLPVAIEQPVKSSERAGGDQKKAPVEKKNDKEPSTPLSKTPVENSAAQGQVSKNDVTPSQAKPPSTGRAAEVKIKDGEKRVDEKKEETNAPSKPEKHHKQPAPKEITAEMPKQHSPAQADDKPMKEASHPEEFKPSGKQVAKEEDEKKPQPEKSDTLQKDKQAPPAPSKEGEKKDKDGHAKMTAEPKRETEKAEKKTDAIVKPKLDSKEEKEVSTGVKPKVGDTSSDPCLERNEDKSEKIGVKSLPGSPSSPPPSSISQERGNDDERSTRPSESTGPAEPAATAQPTGSKSKSNESEEVPSKMDLEEEVVRESDSDDAKRISKKRHRSPGANESRKRKRTSRNGSPSAVKGPLKGSSGRSTDKKGDTSNKNFKPNDISAAHGMDTSQLDEEQRQIAALAAEMERAEANTRGRRTTRLAAGKINKVDYKASANPLNSRNISPGDDSVDMDGNGSNSSPQGTRSSRRRTANSSVGARPSRRTTRNRGNQEKVQTTSEEGDQNDDVMDDDDLSEYGDGRPYYKRSRSQSGGPSKRARYTLSGDPENDNSGKQYSTRASTRENSVADAGEATDVNFDLDEDLDENDSIEERADSMGLTIADLNFIGQAVKDSNSVRPGDVLSQLLEQDDWIEDSDREKSVKDYVTVAVKGICSIYGTENVEGKPREVSVNQLLSFIVADIRRLRTHSLPTGFPRKPTAILRQADREEQQKVSLERNKKKETREVDDMRNSLEKEMEGRRKAHLENMNLELLLIESRKALQREEKRAERLNSELKKYRKMEEEAVNWLSRTKVLIGQLRGESDRRGESGDVSKDHNGLGRSKSRSRANTSADKDENINLARRKSEEDVHMTDNNMDTTITQRMLQMDRYRALIAGREAEAQQYQRACERHRLRFVHLQELKGKLSNEIFALKSSLSGGGSGGVSTPTKSRKDSIKKENRASTAARNSNGNRSKSNGKPSGGGGGFPTPSKGASKPKTGNGNGKSHKRKSKGNGNTEKN